MKKLRYTLSFMALFFVLPLSAQQVARIIITFKKKPAMVNIIKAPLKYNKDFAYSLTLDDGLVSAYLTAFPVLNGGQVAGKFIDEWNTDQGGDSKKYPGCYYTDGCGKPIPFRAAIAITSANKDNQDIHDGTHSGNMTWKQIETLYRSDWDIINHSYSHATDTGTDYDTEIQRNIDYVKNKTGINLSLFFIPGGKGPQNYDSLYVEAAFRHGMIAADGKFGIGPYVEVDSIKQFNKFICQRGYVTSSPQMKDAYRDSTNILKPLVYMAEQAKNGRHLWYNELTHGTGNDNLWNISLKFPMFSYFMTQMAKQYGKDGKDNLWMAPYQEVFEYLVSRNYAKVTWQVRQNQCIISLDLSAIPFKLRGYALTLKVNSDADIYNVIAKGIKHYTYSGSGKNKIINCEF